MVIAMKIYSWINNRTLLLNCHKLYRLRLSLKIMRLFLQFWSLIQNKNSNLCTGDEAYHTMQIIEGIRKSHKLGKKITVQ